MDVPALLRDLYLAGVAAVEPSGAVRRAVSPIAGGLRCAGVDHPVTGRAVVLALGKAAGAMVAGLLPALEEAGVPFEGVIVTDRPEPGAALPVIVAGHPDPTAESMAGAHRLLDLAASASPGDLVVVLLSGGGSALAALPAPGLSLVDVAATADLLMRAGAGITELNCVRKHLSAFSGGRLAEACRGSSLLTLLISDVVGDALDVIASGPTVPDPTTYADALAVLRRRGIEGDVPGWWSITCGRAPPGSARRRRAGRIPATRSRSSPRARTPPRAPPRRHAAMGCAAGSSPRPSAEKRERSLPTSSPPPSRGRF